MAPGAYYVRAGEPAINFNGLPFAPTSIPSVVQRATVYYPNQTNPERATRIEIRSLASSQGIDFVLAKQNVYQIRGSISDGVSSRLIEDSRQPPIIYLVPRRAIALNGMGGSTKNYKSGGLFELVDVAPGEYWILAVLPPETGGSPARIAKTSVEVIDRDIDGVALVLFSNLTISGRVLAADGLVGQLATARVELQSVPSLGSSSSSSSVSLKRATAIGADGTFVFENVPPDEYRVRIQGLPDAVYVQQIRLEGRDLLLQALPILSPPTTPVIVTLSDKAGRIEGSAKDQNSNCVPLAQVALIPEQTDMHHLYHSVKSDREGHFVIGNISPGKYRLLAWPALPSGTYFGDDMLGVPNENGVSVEVSENSVMLIDALVISAPH